MKEIKQVIEEIKKAVVGKDEIIEKIMLLNSNNMSYLFFMYSSK